MINIASAEVDDSIILEIIHEYADQLRIGFGAWQSRLPGRSPAA